jgi:hypothetical protein
LGDASKANSPSPYSWEGLKALGKIPPDVEIMLGGYCSVYPSNNPVLVDPCNNSFFSSIRCSQFIMKQIVTYFLVALFISGCSHQANHLDETPPQLPDKTRPETSTNPQQALVIGNSEYEYSPLTNPDNDAKDMADALELMGFEVTLKTNLSHQAMKDVQHQFGKRLRDTQAKDSVGLFYFAGHGARSNGENYLLPINNGQIKTEPTLKKNAFPAKTVLARMEDVNKGMNIIVLDACRDNPYPSRGARIIRGLNRMPPPVGALIAFATEEGKTASDSNASDERNSLYTKHLLNALADAEHQRIEDVFMQVRNSVNEDSEGAQVPWYQASLNRPFCFGGCQ